MFLYDGSETSKEFTPLYSWWASVLIVQVLSFAWFTGRTRVRCETIHSEEDRMWLKNPNVKLCINGGGHPDVDHIRSGHFNDLVLIIPYLLIVPIWLNTSPSALLVNLLLRAFPIAKLLDTLLFMEVIKAPVIFRLIFFVITYIIMFYLLISILYTCL